jgi:hypothetical protein
MDLAIEHILEIASVVEARQSVAGRGRICPGAAGVISLPP